MCYTLRKDQKKFSNGVVSFDNSCTMFCLSCVLVNVHKIAVNAEMAHKNRIYHGFRSVNFVFHVIFHDI